MNDIPWLVLIPVLVLVVACVGWMAWSARPQISVKHVPAGAAPKRAVELPRPAWVKTVESARTEAQNILEKEDMRIMHRPGYIRVPDSETTDVLVMVRGYQT